VIRGLRTLADVELDLTPLTVLIGANGTGKSSVVEGCELLRKVAWHEHVQDVLTHHGGLASLLRQGARALELEAHAETPQGPLVYCLTLESTTRGAAVVGRESLQLGPLQGSARPRDVLRRDERGTFVFDQSEGKPVAVDGVAGGHFLLSAFGVLPPQPAIQEMRDLLGRIEVHVPFDTTPHWAAREVNRQPALRDSVVIQPVRRLSRFGANLANAFHALRTDFDAAHWEETLDYVRMGLGHTVEDVKNPADPSGGRIGLAIKYRYLAEAVPAFALSDGTLSYLAIVAAVRLANDSSLFVLDEPEDHLHPDLLMRALSFFERLSADRPVVLATHSDRLLDGLDDPEKSAVLFELSKGGETEVQRPEPTALKRWLEDYRGLGEIRGAGFLRHVMAEEPRR